MVRKKAFNSSCKPEDGCSKTITNQVFWGVKYDSQASGVCRFAY
jgi:hypothetical protein